MFSAISYEAFRDALNALKPGWVVVGNEIIGPNGAAVRLDQQHESSNLGHYDVQFVLDRDSSRPVDLWDCVGGAGATEAERARFAAQMWSLTTAGTVLELKYSGRGEFADHYRGSEPDGFAGWHAIHGAIIGFGAGDNGNVLQKWWIANPVLPAIAAVLAPALGEDHAPYGVKILFGGNGVGEVRVNGHVHEAASTTVANLPWPRLHPPAFVRSYVLLIHPDT